MAAVPTWATQAAGFRFQRPAGAAQGLDAPRPASCARVRWAAAWATTGMARPAPSWHGHGPWPSADGRSVLRRCSPCGRGGVWVCGSVGVAWGGASVAAWCVSVVFSKRRAGCAAWPAVVAFTHIGFYALTIPASYSWQGLWRRRQRSPAAHHRERRPPCPTPCCRPGPPR